MKRAKKYHQLIAVNLQEKIKAIELNPPKISGFKISRLEYLLSLVLSYKRNKHMGSYSILNMSFMRTIIPQANEYIKFLQREGIIESVNYSAGRNSRLYRLVDYEDEKTEERPIIDQQIIRRLEKSRPKLQAQNSKKYPFLNRAIRQIEMDFDEARKTIEQQYKTDLQNNEENAEIKRTYALAAVQKLEQGHIYYKVNSTNGRLDSNVTNLPGYLMKHLRIKNYRFVEMDISNAQPFFAAAMFYPTAEINNLMKKYLKPSIISYIKTLVGINNKDVILYRSLASSGKLYEYMAEKFTENNIPYKDRKDLKTQMFVVFFGKRNAHKYNDAARLFKKLFPVVWRVFDKIKEKHHNLLAIFLQRMESYTILERVASEIENELPDLPLLTKHDSILPLKIMISADQGVIEKVRLIMVQTITEVLGITPQGRMKKLI